MPQKELFTMLEQAFGTLEQVHEKIGTGPALLYSANGYPGRIGFIAALSDRFCDSCNRIRLTSTGFLKTCLCHDAGVDLRAALQSGASDHHLRQAIQEAVAAKPLGHTFSFKDEKESGFSMNLVGG
jgi:cyclic pyranopterin phosphate synthase